ncbi:MAG: AMP-binding protein [Candidatus Dormibacteraeota bacterium]|uniref:AMP-binding protein n=1 Tax=Candidatus Aeolococcus gillhamiae TaxID=3127015 RepID=A0A934K252_9BACT|nr:AMP-binding protein [Candidatus Dormibacteraeota bacterium]
MPDRSVAAVSPTTAARRRRTPVAESLNLAQLAEDSLARVGDHDALVFEGETWRSAALHERARRVATGLAALGVQPGDRVVVLMANCPEVLITYNAIWRAGAVVTPVVFLVTAAELGHILVDSSAVAVVTTPELLAVVRDAAATAPTVRHIVVASGGDAEADAVDGAGARRVDFVELEADEPGRLVYRGDDELAALMYTGGTTGRAKGVALSHRNLWRTGKSAWQSSNVPGLTRVITPLPLSHAYGMIVTIVGMHADEPSLAVIQRWFNTAEWVTLCERYGCQRTALVPAMMQMLLAEPLEEAHLESLRYVTSGAAPLALEVLREFERRVPSAEILEGYGCTETSAVISSSPPARRRVGSVGVPIRDCEVRILDDADRPLGVGEDGEICVRSPGVMSGYWNAPQETAEALRDGWLHTGDVGHFDSDGYLYVVDRKKDLILRGGFNVFPRDVEDVLLSHADVTMAGVVGRPDPRLGEEVVAFVTIRPGASVTADELIAHARSRLSATKSPREVQLVESMPLTSVGKLDRKALRALLADCAPVR